MTLSQSGSQLWRPNPTVMFGGRLRGSPPTVNSADKLFRPMLLCNDRKVGVSQIMWRPCTEFDKHWPGRHNALPNVCLGARGRTRVQNQKGAGQCREASAANSGGQLCNDGCPPKGRMLCCCTFLHRWFPCPWRHLQAIWSHSRNSERDANYWVTADNDGTPLPEICHRPLGPSSATTRLKQRPTRARRSKNKRQTR